MRSILSRACLVVLLGSLPAVAQKHSRFDELPEERYALVARLTKQSVEDKQAAREWARMHGKPMRFKRGGVLHELMTNHQEFGSRVVNMDGASSDDHATHIGGTIGASGVNSQAKGMAPAALIDSYDWSADSTEMASAAAFAPGQAGKLYLSNHSYSYTVGEEYLFGQYSSYVATVDGPLYGSQYYLPFWSAALLVDYYDDLFPGGAMRASTLKGLIIHTADDLGRPGPDYSHGWGLMNTLAAAELLRDSAVQKVGTIFNCSI